MIVCIVMKRTLVLLLSCLVAAVGAGRAETAPAGARAVYLLPMAHGFDQFLANHLAGTAVFDVVTDPKLADAVLTDRIGRSFEAQMRQMYPESKPARQAEAGEAAEGAETAEVETIVQAAPVGAMSSFGRGRGNFFLVDTRTAHVMWSTYEKLPGADPTELNRAAERIVARLKKDMLRAPRSARAAAPRPEADPEPAPRQ
jgi:hypothetical protein